MKMQKGKGKAAKSRKLAQDRAKTGRPPTDITEAQWKTLERMAGDGCTHEEMADFLGIARQTFYAPHLKERFRRLTKMAWAKTRWKVRQRQLQAAVKGHVVGSIWWGKQHLGQKDRHEHAPAGTALDMIAGVGARLTELMDKHAKDVGASG